MNRHEWYQSPTMVFITVYAKNISKDHVKIDATETTVSEISKYYFGDG